MRAKLLGIVLVLLFAGFALASGGRPHQPENLQVWGSDDHQKKDTFYECVEQPVKVPEPATLILLGVGGVLVFVVRKSHKKVE